MRLTLLLALCAGATVAGCRRGEPQAPAKPPTAPAAATTNRVDIPATVRQNLGITFAKVEKRAVGRTIRAPGRFESLPTARQEHRAPAGGRVQLLVDPYALVEAGTPLYRLDSPRLRELQQQLADALAQESLARAGVESMGPLRQAHKIHEESLHAAEKMWAARVAKLEELREAGAGVGEQAAAAQAALAAARADLGEVAEKDAELDAQEARLRAEQGAGAVRVELALASLASLTGVGVDQLRSIDEGTKTPAWRSLSTIEVRAASAGTVESIGVTNGGWVEDNAPVLTIVDPARVLFRARGLQSDLPRLSPGLAATILPPAGGTLGDAAPLRGTLALAPVADPDQRTVELIVTLGGNAPWARAGVSGFLEVTPTSSNGDLPLAITLQAVARDGLASIIFRRDPKDANKVIRLEADLGAEDGRYVVISSGVREGDEVVVDGVYQLMVATSGTIQKGGHFHADGTFHEGED
jgi:multidrug efflux pump subunit AcrA (membrane-fusion protein)